MYNRFGITGFCAVLFAVTLNSACTDKTTNPDANTGQDDPFPSTYAPAATNPVLLDNATLLTGTGSQLDNTSILLIDGKISALGREIDAPGNAVVIDA